MSCTHPMLKTSASAQEVTLLTSDAHVQALGKASVVDVDDLWVHLEKDGQRYCFRPQDVTAFSRGQIDCSRLRVYRDASICPERPLEQCALRTIHRCRCVDCGR